MQDNTTHIIALAGSLRADSYNKRLVGLAGAAAAERGASVIAIDLKDYDIPLFSEDIEAEGTPPDVVRLKTAFRQADGILVASPEYNGSISGVLKNVLDWLSRPEPSGQGGSVFAQRVVGLLSASPGGLGGVRGLAHVATIFGNLGSLVLPGSVAVPEAYKQFDDSGQLVDEALGLRVAAVGHRIVDLAHSVRAVG